MDNIRLYGALGLARRAGKCITGDFVVERSIKAGTVCMVVLDAEASDATRTRYRALCERTGVQYLEVKDLGHAIGKSSNRIAAIMDERFAGMISAAVEAVPPAQ